MRIQTQSTDARRNGISPLVTCGSLLGLLVGMCLALSLGLERTVLAQSPSNVVVDQIAEAGSLTVALAPPVSGSGPAAPVEQLVCAPGGSWVRLRLSQLVLQGTDTLELVGSLGGRLVFQGNNWTNRTFFTRAFAGDCVTVRPTFAQAGSQFAIDTHQSGAAPLASTPMITAGAGDICDITLNCATTATTIEAMNPPADVIFTLGDNQYENGLLTEYNRDYDRTWGRFKDSTRPVSGNHEYQSGNAGAGYFDYFNGVGQAIGPAGPRGRGYYSYDIGDWHVVVLNTSNAGVVPYSAGSVQEQWLRRDLAANTKPCTMAQWHHPRFSRGNYRPGIAGTQALWQAMQDYRADVVLSGHDHNYQRYARQTATGVASPDGLRLFIVGTGGRAPYAFGATVPNFEVGNATNTDGVLKLTLTSGGYSWQFLPAVGTTFTDSGSASCHNAPRLAMSVSPTVATLQRGGTTTATVTVSSGTSSESTTLSVSGLPSGITASFEPASVTPPASGTAMSTLTLQASTTAATGTVTLTLSGTAGTATASATLELSVPDSDPPAAPTGLSATPGAGRVTVAWSGNGEPDLAGYRVKRATAANGPFATVATVAAPGYTNTGLANGTTYYYVVTAVDASGNESGNSNVAWATPVDNDAPAAPTGLTAVAGNGQVGLDWANNAEPDLATYRVKRASAAAGPFTTIATVTTSAYTDMPLTNGVTYYYAVSALDTANNESPNSSARSATPTAEVLLEESTATGNKIDVKLGQAGAQSFSRTGGGPYFVSRIVFDLSREFDAPNGNLNVGIGTAVNGGAISGMTAITPAQVSNNSGGSTFQTFTVTFSSPVGPLQPNTAYYVNFSSAASNGKTYFLRYAGSNVYPRGTYYKGGSNDAKDIRLQIFGTATADSGTPNSSVLLEQSTASGDKIDIKLGQSGAQSFSRSAAGNYYLTRLVLNLSRESEAPNGNLVVSIGTGVNSGPLAGSTVAVTPALVTNGSSGVSFQTVTLTLATPVGPLAPNTTYYLNFLNGASNGKAYYLQYAGSSVYAGGTYFKQGSNDSKDARFELWGTVTP